MAGLDDIRIPVTGARAVTLRLAPLPRAGVFAPDEWRQARLARAEGAAGEWWGIDLATLALADGAHEYEFVIERANGEVFVAPDPYAEEATRYGGTRGVLHVRDGHRVRPPFSWEGELTPGRPLPGNNELVIHELPMRWVDAPSDAHERQVGLGTFDKALFEHLDYLEWLGVNAIELLPVQDSPDTLNWGYGTRFFFAPDLDMGAPFELKQFVKGCHRRGMRVILDVVMNHSRSCPLERLAYDMFYLAHGGEEPDPNGDWRNDWGGRLFRYREPRHGAFLARDFHFGMAEFWIGEYRIDGFRLDEFKGIDNWDFLRDFRARAWAQQQRRFPGRPFIVIAEDSWRRAQITHGENGPVADAMWDFDFRDELRRLVSDDMPSAPGQPSRAERVQALLSGARLWDDMRRGWRQQPVPGGWADTGFRDLAQRVTYCTSHDVEGRHEQRLLPYFIERLKYRWSEWDHARCEANLNPPALAQAHEGVRTALAQVHAAFALMLTAAGIPMFLAGEEFAELHDTPHHDWRLKMSDPVDWRRASLPGHRELLARVRELILLRRHHPALQRNELEFFGMQGASGAGFHPQFNQSSGARVFACARTGGQPPGSPGQVLVIANCGGEGYERYALDWPWAGMALSEHGGLGQPPPAIAGQRAELALLPFQVRVFSTEG